MKNHVVAYVTTVYLIECSNFAIRASIFIDPSIFNGLMQPFKVYISFLILFMHLYPLKLHGTSSLIT